jgi:hypothetical protein
MESHLRPMSLGEILDRTAQLYRENFLLFAGIASVYAGVLLVVGLAETGLQEWLRVEHMNRALAWTSGVSLLITYGIMFIFGGIAVAANNRAVAWLHLGEAATIRGAYRSILPRVGRYLGLQLLKTFFAWSPLIAIYMGFIALFAFLGMKGIFAQAGTPPTVNPPANAPQMVEFFVAMLILGLLFVPALVYGVMMGLRYALAVPACVVENLKARAAIRRSIVLSKFSRGRIFVLWLLVAVIEIGLGLVSQSFFVFAAVKNRFELAVGWRILQQFVGFCTTTFVAPILATGLTLFYYDQRVRKEGYDIEWMMQAAGMTAPVAQTTPAEEWPAAAEALPAEPGLSGAAEAAQEPESTNQ